MYKMNVASGHDDEEFNLLFGEIPNTTTSGGVQSRELGNPSSSQNLMVVPLVEQTIGQTMHTEAVLNSNYYQGSQSQTPGVNAVSRSPVSASPVSSSSFHPFYNSLNKNSVYDPKVQKEDSFEGVRSVGKQQCGAHVQCSDQESSELHLEYRLPDDQSLASAFASLNIKSGNNLCLTSESSPQYKGLPKSNIFVDSQYHGQMGNQQYIEEVGDSLPQSLNSRNSLIFGNSAIVGQRTMNVHSMGLPSVGDLPNLARFGSEANRERDANIFEPNINYVKNIFSEYMTNFGGKSHVLPIPLGPFHAGNEAFQVHPRVPVSGVEFQVSSCQQQCYLDPRSSQFVQPQQYGHSNSMLFQQLNRNHVPWQHEDEDRCRALHQPFTFLHNLQNQGSRAHDQVRLTSNELAGPIVRNSNQSYCEFPASQAGHSKEAVYSKDDVILQGFNQSNAMQLGSICRYHARGFCIKGENCPFVHEHSHSPRSVCSCTSNSFCLRALEKESKQISPEKMLTPYTGLNSLKSLNTNFISANTCHANNVKGGVFSNGCYHHHPSGLTAHSLPVGDRNSGVSLPDDFEELFPPRSRHYLRCTSLDEIKGKIYTLAKDQHGCRYLQDKSTNGTPDDVEKILAEIIDNMVDLMKDPFGNYLVQKLLDVCNENQRIHIIHVITATPGDLIQVSCNMHGTRSVQKVIETIKTPEQIMMIVSALEDGVVKLMKDSNGNHVIQRCLQFLDGEYNEFLFDAAVSHCVEIATHRHGCCVLQKCLQCSDGKPREQLVNAVAANSLHLSQDPFGNYVVQYVCDLKLDWATTRVIEKLKGHFVDLSKQKCSSNVVEKCLKSGGEVEQELIIQELIESPLDQLLQDPFANYVIQSALDTSKGAVRAVFVEAIKPYLPALRSSPYGKKIISCVNSRSK